MTSKLKMHSLDLTEDNIAKIAALFPNCISESRDEQGRLKQVVDFDLLRQELSDVIVEGEQERYRLDWVGKKEAILAANAPIAKTLRPCREESVNFDTTENLFIEGDNLDALKLLQENYLGKVKMIYIDPPYNTGKDFIYNDDFSESSAEFFARSQQFDEEGNRLIANTESNGRFHSDWLSMMYSRLKLARNLLADDGVIFISCDDNEQANLKRLCDEIFGEPNFIGVLILKTATDNNPRQINTEHEYITCYARNKNNLKHWKIENKKAQRIEDKYWELREKFVNNIGEIQKELRSWIKNNKGDLDGVTHYDNIDEKGVFHDGDIANTTFGGYKYDVIHPVTGKVCKVPEKGFRFPKDTLEKMVQENDIMFGLDETTLIKPKIRISEAKDILRTVIYEDGRSSTKAFENLMARDIFQNPKSPTILERLISFVVEPKDIVLDFFAGSGTIAEAVINLNTKTNLNLKFIQVQIAEDLDEAMKSASSKAKKTYRNAIEFLDGISKMHTVAEISKERIRRAAAKIRTDFSDKLPKDWDGGFRVLKVDSTNMKDVYYRPDEVAQSDLLDMVSHIKEDRSNEDLLFQVMLDWGLPLSLPIQERDVDGKKVYFVGEKSSLGYALAACFDELNEAVIQAVAAETPQKFVSVEYAISQDADKTNIKEWFKQLSPETDVKFI